MSETAVRMAGLRVVDTSGPIAVATGDVLDAAAATAVIMMALGHTGQRDQVNALVSVIASWCATHDDPADVLAFLFENCVSGLAQIAGLPAGHA